MNIKQEIIGNRFVISLLHIICFFSSVYAESREIRSKYDIEMFGGKVGEFSITQKNENGILEIESVSDIKVKLLFSYRIQYVQNAIYNRGILESSQIKTFKNGKLNSDTRLKLQSGSYLIISDGDTTTVNDSITYSGSLIYFNEPKEINRIFKERNAEIEYISQINEHEYIIKDKKGRKTNKYFYKDGILHFAEMRHFMGTVELKLISKQCR
ncbi:DUF6134 family protein [Maribellus sp. YY47]|uniref:DUF6134 family protein n=1 Tax=Maribellus sp. YY47 TaxID=2929486 RepID=UPI0020010A63|nr:DUF6134 family protein [Maribellus sp. YY47]MCK3683079.1 hypothetical protein [Maribellus sp. YY47]